MPRKRKAARPYRKLYDNVRDAVRALKTDVQVRRAIADFTEAEIFEAAGQAEKLGPADPAGWRAMGWHNAVVDELWTRWCRWLDTATPETTDAEILAAARKFDQDDSDPGDLIARFRARHPIHAPNIVLEMPKKTQIN
jgi:hypothetical protein